MATSKQTSILMDCLDQMAGVPFFSSDTGKHELVRSIIDTLGNYPKPQKKHKQSDTTPQYLGAYLYVSTARNTAKLAQLGYIPFDYAFLLAGSCLEASLGLITEKTNPE